MTLIDIVKMAAANLWRRKMRTFLTILGVIIGTACIVIMVALGLGNLQQFQESIMQSTSLTQIQVYSYGGGDSGKITDSSIEQFKAIEGVKNVTPVMELPAYLVTGKYSADMTIYCVDGDAMDFEFSEGGMFAGDSSVPEIIIGSNAKGNFRDPRNANTTEIMGYGTDAAGNMTAYDQYGNEIDMDSLGPDIDWLNDDFTYMPTSSYELENDDGTSGLPAALSYKAKVVGLLEVSDSEQSYNAYMSLATGKKIFQDNRQRLEQNGLAADRYNQALVFVNTIDDAATVLKEIKNMGYQAYSPTEWITSMQDEQKRQQSQLTAIGLISLLVSAIGIANTMLASILERRREIGVMKVIGLSVAKINVMFLVEAAMIGLFGGVIGVGIGYIFSGVAGSLAGSDVSFLGMYFSSGVAMVIPFWLAMGAIGIAVGIGVISGIYPAWRATKLSPLEAIRSAS